MTSVLVPEFREDSWRFLKIHVDVVVVVDVVDDDVVVVDVDVDVDVDVVVVAVDAEVVVLLIVATPGNETRNPRAVNAVNSSSAISRHNNFLHDITRSFMT